MTLGLISFQALSVPQPLVNKFELLPPPLSQTMPGFAKSDLMRLVNKQHGSQLQNLMFGTPVKSMEEILAEEQAKVRQMMKNFGKGPVSPQVLL